MADAILDGEIKSGTQVGVGNGEKKIKFIVKPDKELVKK